MFTKSRLHSVKSLGIWGLFFRPVLSSSLLSYIIAHTQRIPQAFHPYQLCTKNQTEASGAVSLCQGGTLSMFSFRRTTRICPGRSPPESSTTGAVPPLPFESPLIEEFDDDLLWEPLVAPKPTGSGHDAPLDSSDSPAPLDDCSSFDIDTFPEHSYMYASDRNGTVGTDTVHALTHPRETACSINKAFHYHASSADWHALCNRLLDFADSASESVNDHLNRIFEGQDIPAMHYRIVDTIPSITLPSMRRLELAADTLTDAVLSSVKRSRPDNHFQDQILQGDEWAFARIMGGKARGALVKQKICKEWQVTTTSITLRLHTQLHAALATLFNSEKEISGVAKLYEMTPNWVADVVKKTWRLELKPGLMDTMVHKDRGLCTLGLSCLPVAFEVPETWGCLVIEDVERGVVSAEDDWMAVEW